MIDRLYEEIKELRADATHRSALRIFTILEGNRKTFLEKMEPDLYDLMLQNFNELVNNKYQKDFKDDFSRYCSSLTYHLDRIV